MISPQTLHHRPPSTPSGSVARAALRAAAAAVLIMVVLLVAPKPSGASDTTADTTTDATAAGEQMTVGKAAILGVVEGVTEYLPVSSTGHLYVSQQLLGVGDTQATKAPADSFAIVIQAGAILAVLILYRRRILSVFQGVIGRSAEGRTVGIALVVAFLPAAIIGVLAEDAIKSKLFAGWPIVVAWAVGGLAILVLADRLQHRQPSEAVGDGTRSGGRANVIGTALEAITPRPGSFESFSRSAWT